MNRLTRMMRPFTLWLGILGLCSIMGAQVVSLADDERLQQQLTLQQLVVSLSELISLVSRATGAPLFVERAIADDKVCVLAYDKPAHEILTRLAETLRYDWRASVDGRGYALECGIGCAHTPRRPRTKRRLARVGKSQKRVYESEATRARVAQA